MKNSRKEALRRTFLGLTWRLELFTHVVAVPISVYFSGTLVPMTPRQSLVAFVAGGIASVFIVILGVLWRYFRLRTILIKRDQRDKVRLKRDLLGHPAQEAVVIALRWIIGAPIAHGLFILHQGEMNLAVHVSAPFMGLMIIPVSMAAYFYISESALRRVLEHRALRSVQVPSLFRLGYFSRILFTVLALMSMPLTTQTYLVYQFYYGDLKLENPVLHILVVVVLFLLPTIIAAILVARAVRSGLQDTGGALSRLGEGNFDVSAAATTADEFGEQAIHLNNVIQHLREMYEKIEEMNTSLEKQVKDRTKQLENSLQEVRALKVQQDGDYYLTSHLLRPLSSQDLSSETVQVDQLVKQKKQFYFRDQEG